MPGDDPEAQLRAFFRAEMPHPWPGLTPPDYVTPLPSRNGTGAAPGKRLRWLPALRAGVRSRLALAATIGLLLLGTLLLSGRFHVPPPEPPTGQPVAQPIKDFILNESLIQEPDQPTKYRIEVRELPSHGPEQHR
ncbi:MAG TPA: hypothetical protein VJ739_14570 [Gemmataceae bacterium]|nr:hypothetical protein [Gemmataceae bacterium]